MEVECVSLVVDIPVIDCGAGALIPTGQFEVNAVLGRALRRSGRKGTGRCRGGPRLRASNDKIWSRDFGSDIERSRNKLLEVLTHRSDPSPNQ